MSHVVGLDLEDLSPAQLRKLLRNSMRNSLPKGKRGKPDPDAEDEDEDDEENDDLVDLHREKKGDSKPPKVLKDDLPKGLTRTEEDKEEDK
jgi:hypothetical protein